MNDSVGHLTKIWDPIDTHDWNNQEYTATAMRRIHR